MQPLAPSSISLATTVSIPSLGFSMNGSGGGYNAQSFPGTTGSVALWFKCSADHYLIFVGDHQNNPVDKGSPRCAVRVAGGNVRVDWADYTATTLSTAGTDYRDGKWHFVVVTWSPGTTTGCIYVDGVLKATGNPSNGMTNWPYFGADAFNTWGLVGSLAEVATFGVQLSAAQVATAFAHANNSADYFDYVMGLVPITYWRMNDASVAQGATMKDYSGNGHDGFYYGSGNSGQVPGPLASGVLTLAPIALELNGLVIGGAEPVINFIAGAAGVPAAAVDNPQQQRFDVTLPGGISMGGPATTSNAGDAEADGTSANSSHADHRHAREAKGLVGDVAPVGTAAAAGASVRWTDAAHAHVGVHSIVAGTGVTLSGATGDVTVSTPTEVSARTAVADAAYAILATDCIIGYTSLTATRVATLPTAVGKVGQRYIIKDESGSASGAVQITVATTGGQTIDGAATAAIATAHGIVRVYSDGANWQTW